MNTNTSVLIEVSRQLDKKYSPAVDELAALLQDDIEECLKSNGITWPSVRMAMIRRMITALASLLCDPKVSSHTAYVEASHALAALHGNLQPNMFVTGLQAGQAISSSYQNELRLREEAMHEEAKQDNA